MTGFVRVWSIATGREQMVPDHFFDVPLLCHDLTREPPPGWVDPDEEPAAQAASGPSTAWKVAELEEYADKHDIDLGGGRKKADIVATITKALAERAQSSDPIQDGVDNPAITAIGVAHPDPSSAENTETPATGENQE